MSTPRYDPRGDPAQGAKTEVKATPAALRASPQDR
jgi:hypothetical protein